MKEYERALGLLDVVWSSVRGIDGLLPSDEFLTSLEANIEKEKAKTGSNICINVGRSRKNLHGTFQISTYSKRSN